MDDVDFSAECMLLFGSDTEAATRGEIYQPLPVQRYSSIDEAAIFAVERMPEAHQPGARFIAGGVTLGWCETRYRYGALRAP